MTTGEQMMISKYKNEQLGFAQIPGGKWVCNFTADPEH